MTGRMASYSLAGLVRLTFKNAEVRFLQRVSPGGSYYFEFTLDGETRLVRVSDHENTTNAVFTWPPDYNITDRKAIKPLARDLKRMKKREVCKLVTSSTSSPG